MHIGDHQPLQIMFIARLPTAMLLDAPRNNTIPPTLKTAWWQMSSSIAGTRHCRAFKRLNVSRTGLWWNIPRNLGYLHGLTSEVRARAEMHQPNAVPR